MGRQRLIGLDLDNVLSDFVGVFLEFLRKKTSRNFHQSDIFRYDFAAALGLREEEIERVFEAFAREKIWGRLPVMPGVYRFFKWAQSTGRGIIVITSRPKFCEGQTRDWFIRNGLPVEEVFIADGVSKGRVLRKSGYKLDFFVEDGHHFAMNLAHLVPRVYLIGFPWNFSCNHLAPNLTRVSGLEEIMKREDRA